MSENHMIKAFHGGRIAVRFAYEWHDDSGNWFRSYGNENWGFDGNGLMARRLASFNDLPIKDKDRKYSYTARSAASFSLQRCDPLPPDDLLMEIRY